MSKTVFFSFLLMMAGLFMLGSRSVQKQNADQQKDISPDQKPNIILFVVDDLGWTDGHCFGSDYYQTPNVDRLAAEGTKFTDAYSSCTVCSPTRASLMSGKYPARLHLTDWIKGHNKPYAKMKIPDWNMSFSPDEYTLAEALKDKGYATAHVGKWHLGETQDLWPEHQGFDINIGGWSGGSPVAKGGGGYFSPYKNPRLPDGTEGEYLTERLARETCDFIQRSKDSNTPFFLNFWLYNVHLPLQARQDKIDKYKKLSKSGADHSNPVYAAQVEHADDALGAVMQKLRETGLDKNTIVVFTSDNGGIIGNRGNRKITSNYPLRSGKGDIYEGGVRVPLIFWWPGRILAGKETGQPVISMDLYPTLLALTKNLSEKARKQSVDGVDLSGLLLRNEKINRKTLFWHYPHYHLEGARPYSAIRMGNWKLIEVFEEPGLQLYDLKNDIGEKNNLYSSDPERAKVLYDELAKWRKAMDAQLPSKNPLYDPEREEKWSLSGSTGTGGRK